MRFPEIAEQLATGTVLPMMGAGRRLGVRRPAGAGDYVTLTMAALAAEQDR